MVAHPSSLPRSRRRWPAPFVVVIALLAGFLSGWGADVASDVDPARPGAIPVAYAIDCQAANTACSGGTTTSLLNVLHQVPQSGSTPAQWVQPDDGETWEITAHWVAAPPCVSGQELFEVAEATVSWNGSAWVLSNVDLTDNIVDIDICTTSDSCSGTSGTHAFGYKLIVDVNDPEIGTNFNLVNVKYETTAIDDGDIIVFDNGPTITCNSLGAAVSPTSQTFTAFNNGPWNSSRCAYNCSTGGSSPSMTITYN